VLFRAPRGELGEEAQHAFVPRGLVEKSQKQKRRGEQSSFSDGQDRRLEPVEQGWASLV
jgi:hypothetical protein